MFAFPKLNVLFMVQTQTLIIDNLEK
jgi:hypothetical protein